jgi:hypothetical protein
MKLRHLLFGVLAGVAFVACTNDNEPAGVTPVDGNKVAAAPKYMTVNFVTSNGAATRADGDIDESAINDAAFLFFKNGSQVADPFVLKKGDPDAVTDQSLSETWDDTTKAVVVLENPTDIPTSLVVLVNTGKAKADFAGKTIEDLQGDDFLADYSSVEKGFVMSNAVYNDAAGNVVGAPVGADNVKDEPAAARSNPVKVNVDRVLAKVTVKNSAGTAIPTGVSGVTVDINGWGLVYENTQSYLIKNLPTELNFTWTWNDPVNKRSYWADAAQFARKTGPTYEQVANNALETELYTQENTKFQIWTDKAEMNPTAVIVAATLKKGSSAVDLYKFGGVLYVADDLKILLANSAAAKKYFKETQPATETTPAVYDNFAASEFAMGTPDATAGESYQANVFVQLTTTETIYTITTAEDGSITATPISLADANAALKDAGENIEYWKGGATYYYVPIKQHTAESETDKDVFGIVRNHFYQLDIKSVKGLGTAVPDPTQVIIPETPKDNNYYIAAEIKVLDWKLVSQDVTLGE